jgi:N-acetylneuraminic acid mutarotase
MSPRALLYLSILLLTSGLHANPWIKKANFGGVGRHRALGLATSYKGYIGLGHVNGTGVDISYKDWWEYDPASDSWTQRANFPVNNHGAVGFGTTNRVYVGGGSGLNGEFYGYNPATNTWYPIASCPFSPTDTQGFSVQGKGYVYQSNNLAEYDPSSNSWSLKAQAPVTFGNWSCSFATEASGFVKSGTALYEYKPSANEWIQRANFPGAMSNGSSAFSYKGTGIFTCGYSGWLSNVTEEVWQYNPGDNSWQMLAEFPGTNRRFPVAFSIHDKGYYGTGTNGINLNDFWQFDITTAGIIESSSQNVQVYPLPAVNEVHFLFPSEWNEPTILQLFSTTGQKMMETTIHSPAFTLVRNQTFVSGRYLYILLKDGRKIGSGYVIFND